ncbi:MAG: DnaJ C-terminal domain-containing protein [Candidatus Latescibacterota bacterium]
MQYIDYYGILGVPRTASKKEITKAYRKLARQYHPDVNKDPGAEERFKQVSEAYEVLSDDEKRAKFDRFGADWQAAHHGQAPPQHGSPFGFGGEPGAYASFFRGGPSGFSLFFEHLFGAARGAGPRWTDPGFFAAAEGSPPGGLDHEASLTLSLEEAYRGGRREIHLHDPYSGQSRTYAVTIPAGVRHGQRIRLAGQGSRHPGGDAAGDLYLVVRLLPHADLRLEGHDVHTTVEVMPWTAALGGRARLRTLDGAVEVKIPPGSSSGRRIRLRGRGYPGGGGQRGDLYAEIRLVVPRELSPQQRELFRRLAQVSQPEHVS